MNKEEELKKKHEEELLTYFVRFPDEIDKYLLQEEYFTFGTHRNIFNHLKKFKQVDINEVEKHLTLDDEEYLITTLYQQNKYTFIDFAFALSFSKKILEFWKQEEILKLNNDLANKDIATDDYYTKLIDIKNRTVEIQEEELSYDLLDEVICNNSKGIRIRNFEVLSSILKIELTDLVTVAGTSGFGKSAFLLNIFQKLSQDQDGKYKCHYFNLEVAPKTMLKRLMAITVDRPIDEFNKDNLNKPFVFKAKETIMENKDSYIQSNSISIEKLKSKVLSSIDKEKINVVFVDHIGLLETEDKNYNTTEYNKVTYCMKELRKLALDNNLIVFIASQFDRNSIKSNNISMSSLKSSGEIENSSTHVLLLKDSKQNVKKEIDIRHQQYIEIDVAKNRNGLRTHLDNYLFDKDKQKFIEFQEED